MLRTALLLFGIVIAALVVVALLPERESELPEQSIRLRDARITLYPQADPQAVWRFAAPEATYDPDSDETVLHRITDGRREVGGEVDFTVAAEQLIINRRDDILGDLIFAFLVETGECLTMQGANGSPVLIDQRRGMFDVPVMEISGPGYGDTRLEQMRVSFDLERFEGGGAGTTTTTEFRVGGADEVRRRTVCETS